MKKPKKAKKRKRIYQTPPSAKGKKINWLTVLPDDIWVRVKYGFTIYGALQKTNVDIESDCGGLGTCGKCKIRIITAIGPPDQQEKKLLSKTELENGIRLACRTQMKKSLVVQSETQNNGKDHLQILKHGAHQCYDITDPLLKIVPLSLHAPNRSDSTSDFNRLRNALGPDYKQLKITHECLSTLYHNLRKTNFSGEALLHRNCLLAWSTAGSPNGRYGLIFDIGTTTLVGKLLHLEVGQEIAAISRLNSQMRYGADVIRRIEYIRREPNGFDHLRGLLVNDINAITHRLVEASGISTRNIFVAMAAGNTTMQHMLIGLNPSGIAEAPFAPVITEGVNFPARHIGINLHPDAMLYVMPGKSGYIGGDLIGFILASGAADQEDKLVLGVDMGTNSELFLGNRHRMLTCSAAAGPAFEGGRIDHGMIAKSGAIESLRVQDDKLNYNVIGNTKPKGLCGSGLVDLVAVLLHYGVVAGDGLLSPETIEEAGDIFASRLIKKQNSDTFDFLVAISDECADGRTILLSQNDVRELQLAKGAVAAGIELLLKEIGATVADIDEICLAGALGNYVNPLSAMRIGLIPTVVSEKVATLGNAAATGASMALLSQKKWHRASDIADQIEHVELSLHPGFYDAFIEAMDFPSTNLW